MEIGIEQRALAALEEVIDLPAAQRTSYITQMHDRELASRVTQLLQALDQIEGEVEGEIEGEFRDTEKTPEQTAMLGFKVAPPQEQFTGAQIGPYKIAELIGHGGMGVVYRAERVDGAFERDVAFKFFSSIAPEILRRRFATERQLLARLTHPNIASLIDGGSVELNGQMQPYLVMEYVEGDQLDYDAKRPLDTTLRLFEKVCAAVHHAHTRLVLHRDIKPANVKLDEQGEPKLLDFGVAKLLEAQDMSSLTQQLPAAFTFNYTAPEVLEGEPADIVSEVYSLGVYLHVLVKGELPYDIAGLSYPVMLKTLKESITHVGHPKTDLDAIIAKAMHRDRERRYVSVANLAQDIRLHLSGHPVEARGDSWAYRARRFVKRHTLAVGISALSAIGLTATTATAVHQATLATSAQQSTQRTLTFVQSMFSAADPRSGEPLGPEAKLKDLLQLAEGLASDTFNADPGAQLDIYLLLADTWLGMEQLDQVSKMLTRSEAIFAAHSESIAHTGQYEELLMSLRVALAISGTQWRTAVNECTQVAQLENTIATNYAQLTVQLGCANAWFNVGDTPRSQAWAATASQALSADSEVELNDFQRLRSEMALANIYLGTGDTDLNKVYLDLSETSAQSLGQSGLASLALVYVMKSILPNQMGDVDGSLYYTQLALDTAEASALTPDQVLYAYIQLYHADRLIDAKQLEAADQVFANAKSVLLNNTPPTSHYHATTHFTEYKIAFLAKDYDRAEASLLHAKRIRSEGGEGYTPWQATSDFGLGRIYLAQSKFEQAAKHIARAHAFYLQMYGPDHPIVARYAETLALASDQTKPSAE